MKTYFKLSEKAIKNELQKGNHVTSIQSIDIDFAELSENQRTAILNHCIIRNNQLLYSMSRYNDPMKNLNEIDSMDFVSEMLDLEKIRIEKEKEKQKAAEELEKKEAERVEFLNYLEEKYPKCGISLRDKIWFSIYYKTKYLLRGSQMEDVKTKTEKGDIEKLIAEVDAQEVEKAKKEAEYQEKKKKEEAGEQELLEWAKQKGSELLKKRIQHGMNWYELSREEYAKSKLPDFVHLNQIDEIGSEWKVKNASLAQIKMLEKMQIKYPDFEMYIERHKIYEKSSDGFNYEDQYYHKTYISTCVYLPDTSKLYMYHEIEDVPEEDDAE
jgi:hypothetical protein